MPPLESIFLSLAALKLPETGSIGLERDRGQMEYRRLRVETLAY